MSEDRKTEATPQATTETPQQEPAGTRIEPISLDLEELTEEGREKAEQAQGRTIEDIPYTLSQQEERPGSVLAFTFEIDPSEYEKEQTRLLKDLGKDVTLPGFRKGKAPLQLLRKRLGKEADRDTVASVAVNVLRQETTKGQLEFISKPQVIAFDVPEQAGKVRIEIEAERQPRIELNQYKGFSVEVEQHTVTEERIDQRLEQLREQNAYFESAPEEARVNPEDAVVVDIEVTNPEGDRIQQHCCEDQMMVNWRQELPEPVPEQLVGKKKGETVSAVVENKATNRRGEEVSHKDRYEVTVRDIKIKKLPELDDEFAKDLGEHETLAALRAAIGKELEEELQRQHRSAALQQLNQKLIEAHSVDPPRSLIAQRQYDLVMQDNYQLSRMGLRLEHVIQDASRYMEDQKATAETGITIDLLWNKIAETEGIDVTDEDLEAEINRLAEQSGRKPLAVRARLEAQQMLDQMREELRRRKIGDFLLEHNEIKNVEPKPETPTKEDETPPPA